MIGMHFSELIREDYRDDIISFYANNLKKDKISMYVEFPIVRKDGNVKWVGQKVSVVYSQKRPDRIEQLLSLVRDIDHIKKYEEEILEVNKEFSILRKINKEVLQYETEEQIIQTTLSYIAELIPASYFTVSFFDSLSDDISSYQYDPKNRSLTTKNEMDSEDSLEYMNLKPFISVYEPDLGSKEKKNKLEDTKYINGIRSSFIIPLSVGKHLFGVLIVNSEKINFLDERGQRIIEDAVTSFTLALYNIRFGHRN